ncbi:hypothetical protein MPH_10672 [Macrophomina phaseolina MS6]|uniref:FHA domain-containing protein n=2 Tax=Macrophomina phaseolina TaxID=35725 RepID=K2RPS4_MACPH|nr:hypothetical protein MPH_10672 [Macrophomina phaseolina MS6]KAH7055788.1 smad nuclear interacting protein [Macrophomina phaseolina]
MPAASVSPNPLRSRRHSLSDDDDRTSARNDRPSSPDPRQKHQRSRRAHSSDRDEARSARRRGRDRSRSRNRSRSWSRHRHRHRSHSRDAPAAAAARDRTKRRHDRDEDEEGDRLASPRRRHHHDHRHDHRSSDRRRGDSPRHSRRSRHARHDHRSRSPSRKRRRPSTSASPPPPRKQRSTAPLPSQEAAFRGNATTPAEGGTTDNPPIEKQRPNFAQTGLLAREANTVAGTDVVLKYNEPADARKPPARDEWRLYVFKGQECVRTVELWGRSCWLVGREAAVADLLVEHPSTSKQHAVLQFRYTTRVNEYGDRDARVRPYLIDLESSNGTLLNGEPVEASRFVEVMDKDVIRFGLSEREYVLMLPPR